MPERTAVAARVPRRAYEGSQIDQREEVPASIVRFRRKQGLSPSENGLFPPISVRKLKVEVPSIDPKNVGIRNPGRAAKGRGEGHSGGVLSNPGQPHEALTVRWDFATVSDDEFSTESPKLGRSPV